MSNFDPTFLLSRQTDASSVAIIRAKIAAWVTSSYFLDLLALFGANVPAQDNIDEMLEHLEKFSDRWDFRRMARERGAAADDALREGQGAARWLSATAGLTEEMEPRILKNAKLLGLITAQDPSEKEYDYILVLGGARLSCKLRPIRAVEVIQAGVKTREIVLLGAARPVADTERDATDTYAPGAVDEFDLIVAGGQLVFGFDSNNFNEQRYDDQNNKNLSWVIRRFEGNLQKKLMPIQAISAPSSDPQRRRANSADTILFFIDRERVSPNAKLLLITSQIYVPYVQLEALRTVALPRKLQVETIGFPGDRMPELQGLSNANHYLQEIRSAIQAARRFCQAYPA